MAGDIGLSFGEVLLTLLGLPTYSVHSRGDMMLLGEEVGIDLGEILGKLLGDMFGKLLGVLDGEVLEVVVYMVLSIL